MCVYVDVCVCVHVHVRVCVFMCVCVSTQELNMNLTLEENGVCDETRTFEDLMMPTDEFIPVIHAYWNDDLTVQYRVVLCITYYPASLVCHNRWMLPIL